MNLEQFKELIGPFNWKLTQGFLVLLGILAVRLVEFYTRPF